jgi:transcriptional regulator GlxA family with amidase domain
MDRRVQRVIDCMKADLAQDLALDEIAQSVNLSHSRLRCLFKTQTGMSPTHYLKHLRMEEAKRLTESTFLNVKQIMNMLGMRDESHFVRDFKRIHGVTPSQYRMSCDNGNPGRQDSKGAAH